MNSVLNSQLNGKRGYIGKKLSGAINQDALIADPSKLAYGSVAENERGCTDPVREKCIVS